MATLRAARAAHTATTLPSGQVLVVGGMADGGGSVAGVELFAPARNTVQELTSLAERRAGHSATLLGDGRVLIAGGYNGEYLASLELFDPSTRRFRPGGSLLEGRSGHTATLLPNGRVLFVGGVGRGWTFLRSAEVYDPETGRSELVGSMNVPRESHTATLLADGRVLVIGGHRGRRQNMEVYASAEVFDPRTRRFEAAGALAIARHKHDAITLADGRVLVIGGADRTERVHYATTEIYTPADRTFERGPSMTHRRYKIAGTTILLPSGDVLVTSGAQVAELLLVRRQTFREVPGRFPAAYRFAAAALLRDGDVFIAGGYSDENENTAGVWRFRQP
ncbi:MAG: Kelch repeat-containing protein [Gemmatimonadaceae bacterium]